MCCAVTDTLTKVVQPRSTVEHGPTTWRCKCGRTAVVQPLNQEGVYIHLGSLPQGWIQLRVTRSTPDYLNDSQEDILCGVCAWQRGYGPPPPAAPMAMRPPVKQLSKGQK